MSYIGYVPAAKPLTSADITDSVVTSAKIVDGTIAIADLSATGTPSSTTFLRGDNTWGSAGATTGQVIQVLSATDSTARSTTSTSFVTGSNTLSVSITPSATANKIFVIVNTTVQCNGTGYLTLYRGATDLGAAGSVGLARFYGDNAVFSPEYPAGISILDSPSTTSSTTYQVYFRTPSASLCSINLGAIKASITLFEIKG